MYMDAAFICHSFMYQFMNLHVVKSAHPFFAFYLSIHFWSLFIVYKPVVISPIYV